MRGKFIFGRAGSGKTSRCLDEIAENIDNGWERPLLLLVPNQFSLEMEKNLVRRTGGKGMDIAQVLSFERLSYRVFSLYGKPDKKILEETGKAALLRKILYDNREKLKYYGGAYRREGFISLVSGMLTELYKYGISPGRLNEIGGDALKDTPLSSKLSDLALILKEFSQYIEEEYIANEQNLDLLAEALPNAEYFKGCKVWLDGFFRFTGQDCAVIRSLWEICGEMTVSLTAPETLAPDELRGRIHAYDPFYETKTAAAAILSIFDSHVGAQIERVSMARRSEYGYERPLSYLEESFFQYSAKPYEGGNNSIIVNSYGDIYEELAAAASEIARLVREEGFRYKDAAVCACDLVGYEHVLTDTFKKYEIPFFIDMSKTIYNKPIVELLRALIETAASGWSAESVIRLLRTGLTGFSAYETDVLENYALEYGISGYKWRLKEWKAGSKNPRYNLEELNVLRSRVISLISPFSDMFSGRKTPTVKEASAALFDFIDRNGVEERLLASGESRRETAQIWGIVVSAFDKVVEVLAEEKADIRLFSQIIEGALSSVTEGFIPQTSDAVILGDIRRTRLWEVRALFVVGLADGALPSQSAPEGLLTDADRLMLAEAGAEMAPFGIRRALEEQFLVYCAFAKPKERLYLSRPQSGFEGEELRKSVVYEKIEGLFPKAADSAADGTLYSRKAFLSELAVNIGEMRSAGVLGGGWAGGVKWLSENDDRSFGLILDGAFASKNNKRLSKKAVKTLLSKDIYSSVTRIERYMKCPFSYFAEYGLRAGERAIYGIKPVDLGNVYHFALDRISAVLSEKGLKWGEWDAGKDLIIEEGVAAAVEELEAFQESRKNRYMAERLKRITKRAVWALDYHVKNGSFVPYEHETGFGTGDNPLPPIVVELNEGYRFIFTGRIDRVDIYDKDGKRYVKIIDYKSGKQKFSLQEVYYGLQLQLMLYMDAYLKSGKNNVPAGVFYFRVADPVINAEGAEGEDVIDKILGELRLSGLVVNDSEIIDALHNNLSGESNIIPVKLNKPKKGAPPEPGASSSVADMERFCQLMKRVTDCIREAGNRLIEGDIEPRPARGAGTNACMYCGYLSVCGFDVNNGYRYRSIKRHKNAEIFEMLEQNNV